MFESFIEKYASDIEASGLLSNIPIHAILPIMPQFGNKYGEQQKIVFLGQDANNLYTNYDHLAKSYINSHILDVNSNPTAFHFETNSNPQNNFISWYNDGYKFWEFPIDFISKKYNLNINPSDLSQSLMDVTPSIKYYFSSFGWGNFSSILFPHILQKKYSNLSNSTQKIDANTYNKIFQIASDTFSNIDFYENICDPDVIIILTNRFDSSIFFKSKQVIKSYVDSINKITMYDYEGNKKRVKIVTTYHPSYMNRIGNQGWWNINGYVDEILNILDR